MDCRFCFRYPHSAVAANQPPNLSAHTLQPQANNGLLSGGGGGMGNGLGNCDNGLNGGPPSSEGFFRFSLNGSVFRLMLLSKDRQNLLKIYSYDFVLVGIQVTSAQGLLDEHIWEFEWKRIERHSKKAVSPIILLGYFRDVLKLGHGDISLKRTIDESRNNVRKAGKRYKAIPRFCDFVTGNSSQLEDLFADVDTLYHNPGFVLQQCAIVNNLVHFSKIIDNPNLQEEDVRYPDEVHGDNPVMLAAKLRHKDIVSATLRSPKFLGSENNDFLCDIIHTRNAMGQSLLAMVALQGNNSNETLPKTGGLRLPESTLEIIVFDVQDPLSG